MKRIMPILVMIMECGLCQAQPLVTWSWQPSEHERNMALMLAEHYCRYRLSDQVRQQQQSQELVILKRYSIPEEFCLLYTSPSPRDRQKSRMPSSA